MCLLYFSFNVVSCKLFANRMNQRMISHQVARFNNSANLKDEQHQNLPLFRFIELKKFMYLM